MILEIVISLFIIAVSVAIVIIGVDLYKQKKDTEDRLVEQKKAQDLMLDDLYSRDGEIVTKVNGALSDLSLDVQSDVLGINSNITALQSSVQRTYGGIPNVFGVLSNDGTTITDPDSIAPNDPTVSVDFMQRMTLLSGLTIKDISSNNPFTMCSGPSNCFSLPGSDDTWTISPGKDIGLSSSNIWLDGTVSIPDTDVLTFRSTRYGNDVAAIKPLKGNNGGNGLAFDTDIVMSKSLAISDDLATPTAYMYAKPSSWGGKKTSLTMVDSSLSLDFANVDQASSSATELGLRINKTTDGTLELSAVDNKSGSVVPIVIKGPLQVQGDVNATGTFITTAGNPSGSVPADSGSGSAVA